MKKRVDISLAFVDSHTNNHFHDIWLTSVWRSESIILASGILGKDDTCTPCPYNTQLCHPSKQEDVGSLEDRFHVVAMVTAPPSWQDNRNSSRGTLQHACVFRKLGLNMWLCFKWWKYITSWGAASLSRPEHWGTLLKVLHPTQKSINRCMA